MKDLKFSVFDLFSFAIPGGLFMIAISFILPEINSIQDLAILISKANVGLGLAFIFIAHVVGNAIDSIGSWLYYKFGIKIWRTPYDNERRTMSVHKQRALVRKYSPENYIYIQHWKVIKTMSHNLSFGFLLMGIILIIKLIISEESRNLEIFVSIPICIIFGIIFMNRAKIYDSWHYKDLTDVVSALHLKERVENEINNEKKES